RASAWRGVSKLARAVKTTLGPAGRNAVIDRGWGEPIVTRDGASVADEVDLTDPYENMAARLVGQAAERTAKEAGGGPTAATVLAERLFELGLKQVVAGASPMILARGIRQAVDRAIEKLKSMSVPVKTSEQVRAVATVAANHDQEIGKTIASALDKVGKDGVVTIEESKGSETEVRLVEGMEFDRGYLSPHFVTDP